jgi:MFS family permease
MSEKSTSPGRYAWTVVALLFPVALLNYLDRQMIASMKMSVMQDITSIGSEENWGYMLGQFKWVYAFFSPVGGYIADRFSRKYTITGSLIVWSAITWYTGQVQTYNELLWTRTAMGVSEAFYIPAALAMIADYHTGGTRSRAVGVHQTGIYCGVMIGGFAGFVNEWPDFGWRGAFDYTGLAGILYAVPLLLLLKDAPRPVITSEADAKPSVVEAGRELFTNRSFLLLVLYFTLPAVAAWVVRDWMPAILQKEFNISQGIAGMSASIYWQAAAICSAMFGGWLADRRMKATPRGRIQVSALGMILIVPALFGVGNAPALHSFGLAVASLILFGIGWGFFDINNMPILSQITRPQLRATGYGIMNFVSMFSGGLADWGFGRLNDLKVPLNVSFGVFASFCIISVFIVLMIRPRENAG